MDFEQFHLEADILKGVNNKGFKHPTPIQEQSLPESLMGKDILGLAQTGTGKTAAFLLPIFQKLYRRRGKHVRSLVLVPTRELAEQVYQDALMLGKYTGIRSAVVYGGVSKGTQTRILKRGVDLIIACPGRLLDHLSEGYLDLSNVELFVLDEADTMCDMGFLPDVRRIIRRLPVSRQTLFFSATMPKEIRGLVLDILDDPVTVQIGDAAPAPTVSHALYPVPSKLKKELLFHLIRQTATGQILIFARTKYRVRNLAGDLQREGHNAVALQGNMSQSQRQRSMEGFRKGKHDILVATDIAAHGLDVSGVTHVINFDMPDTVDAYTHRIGRTGRALRDGEAFTLACHEDLAMVRSVEKIVKSGIERCRLADFDYGDFRPENAFPLQPAKPKSQKRSRSRWKAGNQRAASNNTQSPIKAENRQGKPSTETTGRNRTSTTAKNKSYSGNPHRTHPSRG